MSTAPATGAAASDAARTLFFGSGPFAVPILDALLELPAVRVVAVVSVPDQPVGRDRRVEAAPVAAMAAKRNLPLLQPGSLRDSAALDALRALRPELGVLADYGRIVPQAILDVPAHGFLNIHPSLLPRHRGATPIPAAILAGDTRTGVTIIRMDAGIDSGPIVASDSWPLEGTEAASELEDRAAAAGAALLASVVPRWLAGQISPITQAEAAATLTRPLRRDDGRLVPNQAAIDLERRVRAMQPWPGAWIELTGQAGAGHRVAVLEAAVAPPQIGDIAATLVADDDGVAIATGFGRLRLLRVQPAGGRPMSGAAWRRGRRGLLGTGVEFRTPSGTVR